MSDAMIRALRHQPTLTDRVELFGSMIPRLTPFILFAAFGPVVGHLMLVRAGVPAEPINTPALIWTTIMFSLVPLSPVFAPWRSLIRPDARTLGSLIRSVRVYARYGGFGSMWITTEALHIASPSGQHVYPFSSIEEVVVQRPTNPLEPICPVPLHYSVLVRLRPGCEEVPTIREVPLFVLAPVSVTRSLRAAIRASADEARSNRDQTKSAS